MDIQKNKNYKIELYGCPEEIRAKDLKQAEEEVLKNISIIEVKEEELENFFVLTYDQGDILVNQFKATDRDRANEIFEEEMQTNFSSDWILEENDFDKLVKVVKEYKKE